MKEVKWKRESGEVKPVKVKRGVKLAQKGEEWTAKPVERRQLRTFERL